MQKSVSKFLNQTIKENSGYAFDIFVNAVITNKAYLKTNLEIRIQRNNNLKIMGKAFLKPEEQEICNKAIEASKTTTKRVKI